MPSSHQMNRCGRLARAALALFALSCGAAHAFSIAPYFPLSGGATWTYRMNGTTTNIRTMVGTRLINGSVVSVLRDSSGEESYYTNDANGIREHGEFIPSFFVPGAGTYTATVTLSPPLLVAPSDVTLGVTSSGSGTATLLISGLGTFPLSATISSTAQGFELVSVPAGSFNDALRARTITRVFGTITGPGGSATIDITQDETIWLVSGIGVVKYFAATSSVINGQPQGSDVESAELISSNLFDAVPNSFAFTPLVGVPRNTAVTSSAITPTGYNMPASVSISAGGSYSINGGPFVTTVGTISPNQTVAVRLNSAASNNTQTCTTLTIAGVAGSFCATTLVEAPTAPTAVSAIAGSGLIIVNFVASANNGGAAITGYTANCSSSNGGIPGSNSGGANVTSIAVSGLTNGKTYTCTVTASNATGASPPSAQSNAVTPFDFGIIMNIILDD